MGDAFHPRFPSMGARAVSSVAYVTSSHRLVSGQGGEQADRIMITATTLVCHDSHWTRIVPTSMRLV